MRRWGMAAAAAMMGLGLAGARTVPWSASGDPNIIDPRSQNVGTVTMVIQQIYDPLIHRNADLPLLLTLLGAIGGVLGLRIPRPSRGRFCPADGLGTGETLSPCLAPSAVRTDLSFPSGPGMGIAVPAVGMAVAFLVLFFRRPDILLDAKLWAEDGTIWYAAANKEGWLSAMLSPQDGYFQTISRIVFGMAQAIPFESVPLFANLIGLAIRAALVGFIFSGRFGWMPWSARFALVAYYLLMPRIEEVHANITNAHWYLAMYALMVVIAAPPRGRTGQLHDYAAMAVAGLSGPFILLLVPCLAIRLLRDGKHRPHAIRLTVLAAILAFIQLAAILLTAGETRAPAPLGATAGLFIRIVGSRVVAGAILPRPAPDILSSALLIALAAGLGIAAIRAGGWRAACIALFAVLQIAAALGSPMMSLDQPQWPLFLSGGDRYFVIPRLLLVSLAIYASSIVPMKGRLLAAIAAIFVVALLPSFRLRPVPGPAFAAEIDRYRQAAVGETVVINIAPPSWTMTLVRH